MTQIERIEITNPNDVALMRMASGALFGNTTLPSGYRVPTPPEGRGYYPRYYTGGKVALVLEDLQAKHRGG